MNAPYDHDEPIGPEDSLERFELNAEDDEEPYIEYFGEDEWRAGWIGGKR